MEHRLDVQVEDQVISCGLVEERRWLVVGGWFSLPPRLSTLGSQLLPAFDLRPGGWLQGGERQGEGVGAERQQGGARVDAAAASNGLAGQILAEPGDACAPARLGRG